MTLSKSIRICSVMGCGVLASLGSVQADAYPVSATQKQSSELQLELGLAVSANTRFYRSVGEKYYLFPLVMAEYGRFYLQGTQGGYHFYQGEQGQQWSLEVNRTFDGYSGGDGDYLAGMAERKPTWEAGLAYQVLLVGGEIKGKLMQDIGNRHKGVSARLEFERPAYTDDRQMLSWYAGVEYWDRKKTDYYFGVATHEVRGDRVAYKASASHNFFVGLNALRQLSPSFTLFFNTAYLRGGSALDASPLIERENQWLAYSGVFYRF